MKPVALLTFLLAILGHEGRQNENTDPWEPLRFLAGRWEVSIDGRLGTGTGLREYEFVLGDNFLMFRHASVRMPQEKSPKGDHHQEIGFFSYDGERETIVLREFFVEGYVNRYVCNVTERRIGCVTEHVESGPGLRARLTLEIQDAYQFDEIFELAGPGQDLEVLFTNRWTRLPELP